MLAEKWNKKTKYRIEHNNNNNYDDDDDDNDNNNNNLIYKAPVRPGTSVVLADNGNCAPNSE